MRRTTTTERINERVDELIDQFDECVNFFNSTKKFTGPSLYFHLKTINMHNNKRPIELVADDLFLDYVYATLASWGMHRMGESDTKLNEYYQFCKSINDEKNWIEKIQGYQIDLIQDDHTEFVINSIFQIISRLKIGIGETKVVVGSKTLHHILPNLVPPIDGEYTMRFFYGNRTTALNQGEDVFFSEIFPYFIKIAKMRQKNISQFIGTGMNTSKTKVVDNAIVGYCDLYLRK